MTAALFLVLKGVAAALIAWSPAAAPRGRLAPPPRMVILPAPPAPPPTHTDKGYGGGDDGALMPSDVSGEERAALSSLWQ